MTTDDYITLTPHPHRVVVRFAGEVVADSKAAVQLKEGTYPPRLYLPKADVVMDALAPTDHRTHCPFKGDASYYSLRVGDREANNAVWAYVQPIANVANIAGLVSFYPHHVEIEEHPLDD